MSVNKEEKGFSYTVSAQQLREYRTWPASRKLAWLFMGNKLRKSLPPRSKSIQDEFRQGKR